MKSKMSKARLYAVPRSSPVLGIKQVELKAIEVQQKLQALVAAQDAARIQKCSQRTN